MRHYSFMIRKTLNSFLSNRPSVQERLALGKAIRQKTSRSSLGEFQVQSNRLNAVSILNRQAETRNVELVPIRHARMAQNPFAFFRGGAAIMAQDLGPLPSASIPVQLCGDMHVSNFGFFSTTERRLVFGINDFDETLPGNFDWDLKRLAASAMVAAESLGQDSTYGEQVIRVMSRAYRDHMRQYAHTPFVELVRSFIDTDSLKAVENTASVAARAFIRKKIAKAKLNTNIGVIGKLTTVINNQRCFIDNPPLLTHHVKSYKGAVVVDVLDDALKTYERSLPSDRRHLLSRYRLVDYARKVVGVGSVGVGCWVMYLEGLDESDPLFLQWKVAQRSVLAPYFPDSQFRTQGERVVYGQRLIQGAPDLFLGYGKTRVNDFYIRQLRDMKGGIAIGTGKGDIGVETFPDYAKLFGWALANAHARSGDPAVLAGYCGDGEQLDDALVRFARAYNTQNQSDYDTFLRAIRSGTLRCATQDF